MSDIGNSGKPDHLIQAQLDLRISDHFEECIPAQIDRYEVETISNKIEKVIDSSEILARSRVFHEHD